MTQQVKTVLIAAFVFAAIWFGANAYLLIKASGYSEGLEPEGKAFMDSVPGSIKLSPSAREGESIYIGGYEAVLPPVPSGNKARVSISFEGGRPASVDIEIYEPLAPGGDGADLAGCIIGFTSIRKDARDESGIEGGILPSAVTAKPSDLSLWNLPANIDASKKLYYKSLLAMGFGPGAQAHKAEKEFFIIEGLPVKGLYSVSSIEGKSYAESLMIDNEEEFFGMGISAFKLHSPFASGDESSVRPFMASLKPVSDADAALAGLRRRYDGNASAYPKELLLASMISLAGPTPELASELISAMADAGASPQELDRIRRELGIAAAKK